MTIQFNPNVKTLVNDTISHADLDNYQVVLPVPIERIVLAFQAVDCMDETIINAFLAIYPRLFIRGLKTINQLAVFLGQLSHESIGFTDTEENLHYSEAQLLKTWPTRFTTKSMLKQCTMNPERLANYVYGGRMGNSMSNGYRYRGRGFIQLTGYSNYEQAGLFLGLPLKNDPDILSRPDISFLTALWYFSTKTYKGVPLLTLADELNHEAVTRCINGGTLGLVHRTVLTQLALEALTNNLFDRSKKVVNAGNKGTYVKEIQNMLDCIGYACGKIDGGFGTKTLSALNSFQKDNNLPVKPFISAEGYLLLTQKYASSFSVD